MLVITRGYVECSVLSEYQAKHQAVHETQVLRRYHQEDYHATQISPTNVPKDQRIETSQFGVSAENWSKRKKIQRKHPKFGGWCPMVFRVLAATLPYVYIYRYQSSDRCNFTNQICSKTCRYLSSRENSLRFMRLLLCWRCSLGKTAVFMSARGVHQRFITHGSVSKPGTPSEHQNSWDLWM